MPIQLFGRSFSLPASARLRRVIGWGFVAGTLLSPLPVFGPWMLPVGLAILSIDSPRIRRQRRRLAIRVGRRWPNLARRFAARRS